MFEYAIKNKTLPIECSNQIFMHEATVFKGIYIITNKQTKENYIGRSNNIFRRFSEHKAKRFSSNTRLSKALRKYGIHWFEFNILELVDCDKEIIQRERFWIAKILPHYNMNRGGHGSSRKVSESTKKVISLKNKEYWNNLPKRKKEKIINRLTGPKIGHSVSNKTREKLRQCNLGKKASQETKNKISNALKGKKRENKHQNKAVYCIDDFGKKRSFNSIKNASKKTNICKTSISKALKGAQKKAGKLIWKYK